MRILVIDRGPFGHLIDAAKLCEYLGRNHEVTYLGFNAVTFMNHGTSEVPHSFVKLLMVPIHPRFIIRCWRWYLTSLREVTRDYDIVYVYHFPGCSALRCVRPGRPMILDIRSGGVSPSQFKRRLHDMTERLDAKFFKNVAIISEGLRRKLGITERKAHILPLGADRYELPAKTFDALHLLYLGYFYRGRELEKTIRAFARLYHERVDDIEMTYTLVGGAEGQEAAFLRQVAVDAGVGHVVRFPGFVSHERIADYLASCNIGMAYVPITEFFDHQPSTKTFEYLMAGMPVLATGTIEHRRLITETNGIVTDDSEDAVFAGLQQLFTTRHRFDSLEIRRSVQPYCWEDIVLKNCLPYLERIVQGFRGHCCPDQRGKV